MLLNNTLIRFSNIRCEVMGNWRKINRMCREEQQEIQFDKMQDTNVSLSWWWRETLEGETLEEW